MRSGSFMSVLLCTALIAVRAVSQVPSSPSSDANRSSRSPRSYISGLHTTDLIAKGVAILPKARSGSLHPVDENARLLKKASPNCTYAVSNEATNTKFSTMRQMQERQQRREESTVDREGGRGGDRGIGNGGGAVIPRGPGGPMASKATHDGESCFGVLVALTLILLQSVMHM